MEFSRRKRLILPQELIVEILSTLPVESLVRFQCVSKAWFSLINDPYFIKMHLHTNRQRTLIAKKRKSSCWREEYYLVNISNEDRLGYPVKIFPPLYSSENAKYRTSVVGSCNGLVCIVFFCNRKYGSHDEIVIWNPSIRKHKKVPFNPVELKHGLGGLGDGFHLAFGYDPVNNDYKILKIIKFVGLKYNDKTMVYSLKANSWRRLEDKLSYKERFTISSPQPVFTNGAFLWLVESITGTRTLLTLDLSTEKFGVQTLPFKLHSLGNLEVLEGSLCVSSAYTPARDTDVWMMKEYGVTSSWSQLCMVPVTFFYRRPLAISKDGKKVLMEDDNLFWYDIKKKTFTIVEHVSNKYCWTTTCVKSLFLLDGDSDN